VFDAFGGGDARALVEVIAEDATWTVPGSVPVARTYRGREEIRRKLADKMGTAFDRVYSVAAEKDITLRQAAMVAAIRQVAGALEARGIYP